MKDRMTDRMAETAITATDVIASCGSRRRFSGSRAGREHEAPGHVGSYRVLVCVSSSFLLVSVVRGVRCACSVCHRLICVCPHLALSPVLFHSLLCRSERAGCTGDRRKARRENPLLLHPRGPGRRFARGAPVFARTWTSCQSQQAPNRPANRPPCPPTDPPIRPERAGPPSPKR